MKRRLMCLFPYIPNLWVSNRASASVSQVTQTDVPLISIAKPELQDRARLALQLLVPLAILYDVWIRAAFLSTHYLLVGSVPLMIWEFSRGNTFRSCVIYVTSTIQVPNMHPDIFHCSPLPKSQVDWYHKALSKPTVSVWIALVCEDYVS